MMEKKSILVTGANGFLGQAILSKLATANVSVRATDLGATGAVSDITYKKADITRSGELKSALKNVNKVIHVAGLAHIFSPSENSDEKFRQINEIGTVNVANASAAANVEHFILISSVSVYGPYTQGMYDENTPCRPTGPYAISKYNAELRAIEIAQKSGMALTILRLATLYGEGDPGNVRRLIQMIHKRRFFWIGDGSNRKSLLYKGDAARACLAIVERPASSINIFNVSAPHCTMREVVDGIGDELGKHPLPLRVSASVALFLSQHLSRMPNRHLGNLQQIVKKWLAHDVYDTRRFEEVYGFHTTTSLRAGLKREVEWYKETYFLGRDKKRRVAR